MTKEEENLIIKLYEEGNSALAISKIVKLHNSTISKFIKKIGISRGKFSKKTLEIEKSVVEDFVNNKMYCEDLAKKYEVDVHTIYRILDKNKIKRQTGFHSNCNEIYFEKIDTPHKAYILGFITADGAVVNNILSIEIHEKDIELLKFIQQQINPKATISKVKNKNNVKVSFGAKKIGLDLAKYGVIQNKSKIIKSVPIELIPEEYLKFYFRGLIDGDGCILKDGGVTIYSGSEDFIKDVQNILVLKLGLTKLKIYKGTTYFISWRSKQDRKKIYDYIYSNLNDTFYYKRKYERLKNFIINEYGNTEVTN